MNKYVRILIMVVVCLTIGFLGSLITQQSVTTWYPTLEKPFFNPPNWLFAPVWTILYVLMGIAAGFVWNKLENDKEAVKKALLFFTVQLLLNLFWSYVFFGLKNILLASIEIVILWLIIYETYVLFKKIEPKTSYLLLPYLAWTTFAAILTFSIYYLNF